MALAEADILDCLVMLGLPARIDIASGYSGGDGEAMRWSSIVRQLLTAPQLSADQETAVRSLLNAWRAVQNDADRIKAEGLDSNPFRTRARLAAQLANYIGFSTYRGGGGIQIRRA
jgi:hypothetical protein